jgi:hypothetical protein
MPRDVGQTDFRTFFVYWSAHLIERVVRFDRYLTERAGDAPSQTNAKHNVIENLRNDVLDAANSLHVIATRINRSKEIRLEDAYTYVAPLQAVVRQIGEAHQRLAYLPLPWSEPDTEILIGNVIQESLHFSPQPRETAGPNIATSWTIVLTNEYNLSNIIVDKGDDAHAGDDPFPSVLSLPAIEKDNTLVWANLFHEVGHFISNKRRIAEAVLPQLEGHFKGASPSALVAKDWLEEIIADLVAVDLVGPAYIYAFATFALFMCRPPLMRPSKRYPSPNARFSYLFDRMSKNGGAEATREGGLEELRSLWDLRLILENGNPTTQGKTIESYYKELKLEADKIAEFDLQVGKTAEKIVQASAYQNVFNGNRFNGDDILICRALTEKLYEGVLIATRGQQLSDTWSVEQVRQDYVHARQLLKEDVNRVAHIMAASAPCRWGWCGQGQKKPVPHLIFANALFLTFTKQTFSPSLLWELWQPINNLDELVSNSIEAVSIARFYGNGESKDGQR